MLESITCDTDPEEIISLRNISTKLESINRVINNYERKIKMAILEEQLTGGFSSNAFSINNIPILKNNSDNIINNLELVKSWNTMREVIIDALREQRIKEINYLIEKIEEKLRVLTNESEGICSYLFEADAINKYPDYQKWVLRKKELDAEISKYEKKLEIVEGMN